MRLKSTESSLDSGSLEHENLVPGHCYRIFDIFVQSSLQLPGLMLDPSAIATVWVECSSSAFDDTGFKWIHEWKTPEEEVTLACARRNEEYVLRIPHIADFHVCPNEQCIRVFQEPSSPPLTVAQLLQDQVIPRLFFHGGRAIFHSSAVLLPNGSAIAFLGSTGHGKSTLASSFHQAGSQLLTDDCLLIKKTDSGVKAIGAYPGLRLWPDSVESVFSEDEYQERVILASGKTSMTIATSPEQANIAPLTALFILEKPAVALNSDDIIIRAVSGQAAMMAMIEAAFVLDLVSPDVSRRNVKTIGEVANSGLQVFTIAYPRQYALLPRVRAAIAKTVEDMDAG